MELSRGMKIALIAFGVLLILGALFGTLAATGVLGGQKKSSCIDKDDKCAEWAASGECEKNADYMLVNCCASCKSSDEEETTPTGSPTGSPTVSVSGCTDPGADNYDETATEDDGSCVYFKSVTPDVGSIKEEVLSDDSGYKTEYEEALDASGINGKTYYTTSLAASTVSDINDGTVTAENQTSLSFINTPAEDIKTIDGTSNLFVAMNNPDNNSQFILQNFLIGDAAFIKDNVGKYFLVAKVNDDNGDPMTFAKRIARGDNTGISYNANIIFGTSLDNLETLSYDEIDFLKKCTVDTKFYIVTGDDKYIENNVSAIVDRGEVLSVAAGT